MFIKKTLSEHENVLLGKKVLSWVSSHDLYRGFARQPYWMAGQWKLFALERTFVPMRKRIYCSCHPIWLLCKTSIGKTGLASEKDLLPVGLIAQLVEVRVQNQSRPEIFRSSFLTTATIMGSCVIKTSVDWHSQPICRPSTGRYVGWHIGRHASRLSVCTRPTPRPICCDWLSVVYRSTVGGIGVLFTVVLLK